MIYFLDPRQTCDIPELYAFISTNTTFLAVDGKDLEETCMQTDLYDDLIGVGSLPTRFWLAWYSMGQSSLIPRELPVQSAPFQAKNLSCICKE